MKIDRKKRGETEHWSCRYPCVAVLQGESNPTRGGKREAFFSRSEGGKYRLRVARGKVTTELASQPKDELIRAD